MGWFNKNEMIRNDDGEAAWVTLEEKIQWLYKKFLKKGDECTVILPEMEMVQEYSPIMRSIFASAGGLEGLAFGMGQEKQRKRFSGTIRPATKGLVISGEGSVKDKEVRIPWDTILNAPKEGKNFSIKLIDGTIMRIEFERSSKRYEEYRNMVIDYIDSKACGVVEDGWD